MRLTPLSTSTVILLFDEQIKPVKLSTIKSELLQEIPFIGFENLQEFTTNLLNN